MSRLQLVNVRLPLTGSGLFELEAADGRWQSVRKQDGTRTADSKLTEIGIDTEGTIDLQGNLLLPGFVEPHVHLDKAGTVKTVPNVSGTLFEAIQKYEAAFPDFTEKEIEERITDTALKLVSKGVLYIRSHLNFQYSHGKEAAMRVIRAAMAAREALSGIVDIQYVLLLPHKGHTEDMWAAVEETIQYGMDALGGAPHLAADPEKFIDRIFSIAKKYSLPIDLHIDESDNPDMRTIEYVAEQTIKHHYQGKVTAGHVCTLASVSGETADPIIQKIAAAGLSIITLPATNLYLQGRHDDGPFRRGLTRVRDLQEAGVLVAAGSDNIQDPFHPFGNGDPILTALLAAYGAHLGSEAELDFLLRLITVNGANMMHLPDYGTVPGASARFVILEATSLGELLAEQPANRYVYADGRWLTQTRVEVVSTL